MVTKYKIKWIVREERTKFRGEDIIELETKPSLDELDSMMDEDLQSVYTDYFPNFHNAVNNECIKICSDWKVLSVEENK